MSGPSIPGGRGAVLDFSCGETKRIRELDLDRREFDYPCDDSHTVVMGIRLPDRFPPEFLVNILQGTIEIMSDDIPEFRTAHLISVVLEEFPGAVVSEGMSEDGELGAGVIWVTNFDS